MSIFRKSNINNLRIIHIAYLVDAGIKPFTCEFIKQDQDNYYFKDKVSGRTFYLRR